MTNSGPLNVRFVQNHLDKMEIVKNTSNDIIKFKMLIKGVKPMEVSQKLYSLLSLVIKIKDVQKVNRMSENSIPGKLGKLKASYTN